jgi:thiol-disulfide isomerase/thioredoxin
MGENRPVIFIRGGRLKALVAIAVLCALTACPKKDSPEPAVIACRAPQGTTSVGEPIPKECMLELLNGGIIRLGSLVGKPSVINFWAAWCTFCIAEMPDFQRVYADLRSKVEFVGADLLGIQGETKGVARTFADKTGVEYPLVFDLDARLYGHFSARLVMPVTIFVKADGVVAFRQFGPLTEKKIRELLRTKLRVA